MTTSDKESETNDIFRHKSLEERASEFNGNLMLDGEYNFGRPLGREIW